MVTDMKRFLNLPAWPFCVLAIVLGVALLLLIAGCGSSAPARGSAQDDALQKQARAATERDAADTDAKKAAELAAVALLDEQAALISRLPADIEKAAKAKADAIVAKAISDAEEATAIKAEKAYDASKGMAEVEREKESKAADARAFAFWTRWIGLGGVLIGAVIGIALARLVDGKTGAWIGGTVAGLGFLATAFGSTATWLPVALIGSIVVALGLWALFHAKEKQAAAAVKDVAVSLSHTLDTVEGNTEASVRQAKQSLSGAINRSGLTGFFDRLRAGWTSTTRALEPIAPELAPTVAIVAPAPVVSASGFPVVTDPRASP